ncbi:MAG: LysM peptidoglycan-binding domain-containing protein [Chloroflexi bacterium]|nr:LysM peptidoglycan-binding domain-containing protein [Chloroflexota bacterium]
MPKSYTIQSGDTLSKIAKQFGVSVNAIAAANNIANPSLIKPAQVLTISICTIRARKTRAI